MFGYLLLGIALLIVLMMLGRLLVSVPPRQLLLAGKWVGLGAIGGATVFLMVTGRLSWALTAAAAFLPWIIRWLERNRMMRSGSASRGAGNGAGQTSRVETATLRMSLDHATGSLDGEILTGPFAGRWLSDLTVADLLTLRERCRAGDPASVSLLDSYLDRHHDGWRETAAGAAAEGSADEAPAPPQAMTRDEAYRILGLQPGASDAEVRAAHRRLIGGLHPDRGGSSFLAALINRARDLLLGRRPQ
ncbi:MAG: hypothetical protein MUE49_08430 [Rhodospirillales bacterium]|nr:hypothetical protein [Rhodospirillales bacterium]